MATGWKSGSARALLAIAGAMTPIGAEASCIDAAGCLCPHAPQTVAVQAEVQSLSKNGVVVAVEALTLAAGATTTLTVGATASADVATHSLALQPGDRIVGTADAANHITAVARIEGDQRVTCKWATTFRPLADNARAAMVSADCKKSLTDLGFKQPPCNDTEVRGIEACSAAPVADASGTAALALAIAMLLGRRRRTSIG